MYANTVRLYSWTSPRRECREQHHFNKAVFSQGPQVEIRGLETGLVTVGAKLGLIIVMTNSSLEFGGRRRQHMQGPWNLLSKPNKKITTAYWLLPVNGLLSNVFEKKELKKQKRKEKEHAQVQRSEKRKKSAKVRIKKW